MTTSQAPTNTATLDQSRELAFTSYLRVFAIAAVVLIHVAGLTYGQSESRSGPAWTLAAFLTFSTKWAVPVFVMVSGTLLLKPPTDPSPMRFYRRRLSRIGIPLLFWHAVYIGVRIAMPGDISWRRIAAQFLRGESYTALYFFWLILGLYVITPLLWPLIAAWSNRALTVAAVGLTALPAIDLVSEQVIRRLGSPSALGEPTIVTQFLPYVGFFLLGYALRGVVVRGWRVWLLALVTGALMAELTVQVIYPGYLGKFVATNLNTFAPLSYHGPLLGLCAAAVFVLVHSVASPSSPLSRPPLATWSRTLGNLTLGVFACHLLLSYLLGRLHGHPAPVGATSVLGIIAQNGGIIVAAFVVSAVVTRVPFLRRTM